jgi:peroxiredoxin Q/BCP
LLFRRWLDDDGAIRLGNPAQVFDRQLAHDVGGAPRRCGALLGTAACYGRTRQLPRRGQHMTTLAVGDKAPAFALKDQHGKTVRLSGFKGQPVVVYFYPKADTPGCTQQSCNLRDAFPRLKKLKAAVVGISPDPVDKQLKFDDKYSLGFPLLADTDHSVAEAWGVWGEKSLYGRKFMGIIRSAFVIDEKGKLAGVFYKVSPKDTVPKVQKVLEEM